MTPKLACKASSGRNFLAKRQVPLITDNTVAGAFIAVTGRDNQAKSRRERRLAGPFFERLVAVIQQGIADPVLAFSFIDQVIAKDGVRKLVILPVYRPFLGEGKGPTALPWVIAIDRLENMLHHARLLIVGFFDQKTVVFDNFDRFLLGRGN